MAKADWLAQPQQRVLPLEAVTPGTRAAQAGLSEEKLV
jgi:hypothetical protein